MIYATFACATRYISSLPKLFYSLICHGLIHAQRWPGGVKVIEAFTAFGRLLQLQPNSIFLSHHSSHQLQLQPAQQYFSLTSFQLQPPTPTCRTRCLCSSPQMLQRCCPQANNISLSLSRFTIPHESNLFEPWLGTFPILPFVDL